MHVALVSHGLPQPSSNGGPMTCFALLQELLRRGHRVSVVSLRYPSDPFVEPERERALGAPLTVVPVEAREDNGSDLFGTAHVRPAMREALTGVDPDVLFVYHWDTLTATEGVTPAPRLGVVDDLWHLPNLRRWQHARPRPSRAYAAWTLETLARLRPTAHEMVRTLNACAACGSFQAQTAEWLRRRGAEGCRYFRAPIVDGGGADWRKRRRDPENPTILLGPSNLAATSTSAGLRLFAREILPALEEELGEGFVVRVVGEGDPPPALARLLPRRTVELTGRIEPAEGEFRRATLQLVPTPFVLGKRVRIIVAWSYGCPVVAHETEAVNLPELRHGENALLGRDGAEIAAHAAHVVRDSDLRRRLSEGGRRTYEREFAPASAAAPIIEALEALARSRTPAGRTS